MWIWILLGIAAAAALIIAGISLYVFFYIFRRPKRTKKFSKHYLNSPHYRASVAGVVRMKQCPCEDVYIHSRDNLKLHGYYYPAEKDTGKFMLGIHGFQSYAQHEFAPYFEFYHDLGYNVLLPDDRAHAPSEGKFIGFGVLDRLDCVDWAKYLVKRFGENIEVLVHGVSMGSAAVLAASGEEDLPRQVTGIVADCGFTDAWNELAYKLKRVAHLPARPFLTICEWFCRHLAGFGFHEYTPVEQVKKAKVPILFVHGSRDHMVPPPMARQLYDACASRKKLLITENAGHAASIAVAPEAYHRTIREFFGI